ncbi:MAG: hypothetical protein LBO00_08370 [Zoogloeaceae bacterium]|jgi:glycerophosphoryl diester phosphodiesterase|nr:hypothetical protein [Zoogloeaceae bacterium]
MRQHDLKPGCGRRGCLRKIWPRLAFALIAFAAFVFLNNTSLLAPERSGRPILLAHRGIAQRFDSAGVANDTCTASRILPPTHGYLENTIASMRASFEAGADIVELDVHPATDGQFAVFHDWTLDCRTEAHGVTRAQSMSFLKTLDIGYGYTADGGKTYPFRGQGVGQMPSLAEALQTFPDHSFLINVKSNDPDEGQKLASFLSALPPERQARLMVYGGDRPIAALRALVPGLKAMSRASLKECLLRYIAYGWTKINNKYGYINERGEEVISPCFDYAANFVANGLARNIYKDFLGITSKQRTQAKLDGNYSAFGDMAKSLLYNGWNFFTMGFVERQAERYNNY